MKVCIVVNGEKLLFIYLVDYLKTLVFQPKDLVALAEPFCNH